MVATPFDTRWPTSISNRVTAFATSVDATHLFFVVTLTLGLALVAAAAFTVSLGLGLLTSGITCIAGGHWLTFLKLRNGAR